MIRGAAFLPLTGALSMVAAACATAPTSDEAHALSHASFWIHGVTNASDSLRRYMEANRAGTDAIEEVLLRRRRAPPEFFEASAVYWLSDSGRPEYLRTLMRFAGDTSGTVATYAIYGLARHAADSAVRARLLEVYASAPGEVRGNMASLLALMNDSSARSLLAAIDRRGLDPHTIEMIEIALSDPPRPAGKARYPCLPHVPGPWKGKCPQ